MCALRSLLDNLSGKEEPWGMSSIYRRLGGVAQLCVFIVWVAVLPRVFGQEGTASLRLARFDIDATPPIGSMMAYDPVTNHWNLGLRARGVVLLGSGDPIVLCAVDWIGIANESHDVFRDALAEAAGTQRNRVAVHALHQHDAPECDFSAEAIARAAGTGPKQYESTFQRQLLGRLQEAIRTAVPKAEPVTHLGTGQAAVEGVASNRRIMGPDGKVKAVRWTATTDPAVRAEPVGVIDPIVSLVSFWNGDKPLAILSYYATHPQSYYRTGIPNPDFPGIARFLRELSVPDALHVHFDGAGGNIGAGKYNDGSHTNRVVLAERLAKGMREAWEQTRRTPIAAREVSWGVEPVALPPSKLLVQSELEATLKSQPEVAVTKGIPSRLAWLKRCQAGNKIDITCLRLGRTRILHMPGELFVEFQLAAKAVRPDLFVAMAAYGDYGPFYIGTAISYDEGGYETGPTASNVAPESEAILLDAIRKLLRD